MTLTESIKAIAGEVKEKHAHIKTREATKTAVVMPLVTALGYNVFDPLEFVPHYIVTDLAHKRETVDYAILKDGKPVILIECRHWETSLDKEKTQLNRFMLFTGARMGVFTNGIVYRFYGDLEKPGVMDAAPFLELDLFDAPEAKIAALENFTKQDFEVEKVVHAARELKVEQEKSAALKALRDKHVVKKKEFLVYLREDVSSTVIWDLTENYRGVTVASGYGTRGRLEVALFAKKCNLLIIDECHFESFDDLMEFLEKIRYSSASFKILTILRSATESSDIDRLMDLSGIIVDVIIRPFTTKRLYAYLERAFGLKKSVVMRLKDVTTESLKRGLVAAEDIYIPGRGEPIVECGVILEDRHILELIKHNIARVKVHEDAFKFINCWEFKKCDHFEECPAFINVDADGFLDGINAGRACTYINNTAGACGGRVFGSWEEKIKVVCRECEFYQILVKSNGGALPKSSALKEHIDMISMRRKAMEDGWKPPQARK
jgi:hypothetical protein